MQESSMIRRNLNGRIADIAAREGIDAEFRYSDTFGGRMLWFLDDGRTLTPGEFADLLGVDRWSQASFLAGGSMTYRDRREARADRLDLWADKREAKGTADLATARARADMIPFGQPMLTDHYSYKGDRSFRNKITAGYDRGFENLNKAESMRSRAEGIRSAAERAIYSDDHDAIDKLRERIAGLEIGRDAIKAYNATCRKGSPDPTLLSDRQRVDLVSALKYSAHACKGGAFPAYGLSNLSGNISTQRKRLAQLEAAQNQ